MKLLILTQKVDINDDVLGFMHGWIAEFAKYCEEVIVICLFKGEYDLPENVKVLSLGKEKSKCRIKYIFRFYKYIWQERNSYDQVFVHMNQVYVILGGLFWKACGKKIALWYTHKQISLSLRIAEKLVDIIFTASRESFRLASKKVKVMGHGINTNNFQFSIFNFQENSIFKILSVGRISPVKDYESMIDAVEILNKQGISLQFDIVGGAGLPEQEKYLEKLKKQVKNKNLDNIINFIGSVPYKDNLKYYQEADLFLNMSHTGSLDKTILEAMVCGVPVVTCNEALESILSNFNLICHKSDSKDLAQRIMQVVNLENKEREQLGNELQEIVVKNHSLDNLIRNILKNI